MRDKNNKKILNWFRYVIKMNNNRLSKKVLEAKTGKRKKRERKTEKDVITQNRRKKKSK